MSASNWFGWNRTTETAELPEIYPVPIQPDQLIKTDLQGNYTKILTDVLERTHGLSDEQQAAMWDSCVMSDLSDGLITRLAKAMMDKKELFLVLDNGVVREAKDEEVTKIRDDYAKQAKSSTGVYVTFRNYTRSDMLKFYMAIEYATVGGLFKSMNLSNAVQIKISDLRASVSLIDADKASAQAKEIAVALGKGKAALMDVKDAVMTSVPDLTATKESLAFLVKKYSFYFGMPEAYITGEQTAGMGTTGENDMRAVERGLKSYFFSVVKPVCEALFKVKLTFKSQDFRQILGSMEVLKTFQLVDGELVSQENKLKIVNRLLELPEDAKGDAPAKVVAPPAPVPAKVGQA